MILWAPPHLEVARILRPERLRALFIAGSFAAFQSGDLFGTGGQDQRSGARLIQSFDAEVHDLVGGQVGQVLAGTHAVAGQRICGGFVHALQGQQVLRRLAVFKAFFDCQGLIEQRIAGTSAQLFDDVFVETFHGQQFADRDIRDFLDGAEAFADQDAGDFRPLPACP